MPELCLCYGPTEDVPYFSRPGVSNLLACLRANATHNPSRMTNAQAPAANSGIGLSTGAVPVQRLSRNRRRVPAWARLGVQGLLLLGLCLGSYLIISTFLLKSVQVVGVSMRPTLRDSERLLLNRWIFYVRSPRKGDIVVLRDPADHGYSVKRIVGLAGDEMFLKRGDVQLNGHTLAEPYLPKNALTYPNPKLKEQRMVCGKDQYIVLGDNRMNSVDSRHYGPVPRKEILGLITR